MKQIKIDDLKPHPRNKEFFDNIEGEKWDEFMESIKTNGVIEPIIITQDNVIVSGHQRVRACWDLGIETIEYIVKEYEDDDAVLLDLIESNIQQRGDIGGSAQKIGKRIKERERIYGVRQGSAKTGDSPSKTQGELAEEMGIDPTTYRKYKRLADMIPELSDAVDAGRIGTEAAYAMMKQLTEEEQLELISGLDVTKKYTERETAERIEEALRNRPAEVVEKIPDDYEYLKDKSEKADKIINDAEEKLNRANQTIVGMKEDYRRVRSDLEERTSERNELRAKLETIESDENTRQKHQIETGTMFNARVNRFIEDVSGYIWLTDEVMELPENDRIAFIRAVKKIQDWANQMETNIRTKMEEK